MLQFPLTRMNVYAQSKEKFCRTPWLGANVYNPLGGKCRVKGSPRQAAGVFAVAANDLLPLFSKELPC